MNWLKALLTKRVKAPVLRELDRAIGKLESGATVAEVVPVLRGGLLKVLRGHLPAGLGEWLLDLVLAGLDWDGLLKQPAVAVVLILKSLRVRVEGARL
jgi:hypothetical protein